MELRRRVKSNNHQPPSYKNHFESNSGLFLVFMWKQCHWKIVERAILNSINHLFIEIRTTYKQREISYHVNVSTHKGTSRNNSKFGQNIDFMCHSTYSSDLGPRFFLLFPIECQRCTIIAENTSLCQSWYLNSNLRKRWFTIYWKIVFTVKFIYNYMKKIYFIILFKFYRKFCFQYWIIIKKLWNLV